MDEQYRNYTLVSKNYHKRVNHEKKKEYYELTLVDHFGSRIILTRTIDENESYLFKVFPGLPEVR
jgi:hypothetical protein